MRDMSPEQFSAWIKDLCAFGQKWGAKPAHNRIGKYLREETVKRLKAHVAPGGRPWKPKFSAPAPGIGDKASLIDDDGRIAYNVRILNKNEVGRALRFRERFGPPLRPVPAIYRTSKAPGAKRAVTLVKYFNTPGLAIRTAMTSMTYGDQNLRPFVAELHFGGTKRRGAGKGKPIPARPLVGLTEKDVAFIENAYADLWMKYMAKG